MPPNPLKLTVGGQAYRVHSNADPERLNHLARLVDAQITQQTTTSRLTPTQALLYAALSLADQLDEERTKTEHTASRTKQTLKNILQRIDTAIETTAPLLTTTQAKTREITR